MLKIYTALTENVDDPDAAAAEILAQLDLPKNQKKHAHGLVFFHTDYLDILAAILKKLPFPTSGCTTSYAAVNGTPSEAPLVVLLLTGDDVEFAAAGTADLKNRSADDCRAEVERVYRQIRGELSAPPQLLIPLTCTLGNYSTEDVMEELDRLSDGAPLFGTAAWNLAGLLDENRVWCNGEVVGGASVVVGVGGNVKPRFYASGAAYAKYAIHEPALITEVAGSVIRSVNNMPAGRFLQSVKVVGDDLNDPRNFDAVTMSGLVTRADGVQVVRGMFGLVRENPNWANMLGKISVGEQISFAPISKNAVLESSQEMCDRLIADEINNTLMFCCVARNFALGVQYMREFEQIDANLRQMHGDEVRYAVGCSGGEICPVKDRNGKFVNAFHNFTIIACAFADD
ncbi:hypothetical protein FACS1894139_02110 [Planctomycetales bacterium]|nr:hypothetical protein FACS1894108_01130 [Planctomycetales bacterium]GHT02949.1 hypothetical protein FACS1894139_02110 [Planctomycetales bacterium]